MNSRQTSMQPPSTNPSYPGPTVLERTAADWLALIDRGMTPAEEMEFERWLAADPRHAEIFGEIDGTWSLLDRVHETPAAIAAVANGGLDPDVFVSSRGEAALGSPGFDSGIAVDREDGVNGVPGGGHPPRTRIAPVLARCGTLMRNPAVLAAAAVLAVVYIGWWQTGHRPHEYSAAVATEIGGLRKMNLPDGSVVLLNTDSSVEIGFTASERRVRLTRGEAHFNVAKNPSRPFVVRAGGVDVRAVGTAFGVRLRPAAVDVLVTEGTVRVDDVAQGRSLLAVESASGQPRRGNAPAAGIHPVLAAGQKVTIPLAPKAALAPLPGMPVTVPKVEIERALAWQDQRLEFVSVPLADIVAELNRYNRHRLVIDDERLAKEHFGGTFRPNDWAGFVRLLTTNFEVAVERRENETILRSAP